jgi:uroporphyrinogen-III synthase
MKKLSTNKIVITREATSAKVSVSKLSSLGFNAKSVPLLEIGNIDGLTMPHIGKDGLVIITSRNALPNLNPNIKENGSFLVVGAKTANLLKEMGCNVLCVCQDVSELFEYIKKHFIGERHFFYLSGDHISRDTSSELAELGHKIHRVVVYRSVRRVLFQDDLKVLHDADMLIFYSKRAAQIFSRLEINCAKKEAIVISENVLEPLIGCGFKWMMVSNTPTEDGMFRLLS